MKMDGLNRLVYERELWSRGLRLVAGVDEAGRGPLAGPVVAAAVIFHPDQPIPSVRDSKKLTSVERETLFPIIFEQAAAVAVADVSENEIDRINILQATYTAMRRVLEKLALKPEHILVDGYPIPGILHPQTALVGGDDLSLSIGAASIVAKVTRDRLMLLYDSLYPQYGFARHKGYGTRDHVQAIRRHGPCPIHRRSFSMHGWRE